MAPAQKIRLIAEALKNARAPLVVFGKGVAYARAEKQVKTLIERYEGLMRKLYLLLKFHQGWYPILPDANGKRRSPGFKSTQRICSTIDSYERS
jgi:hypothetical protein